MKKERTQPHSGASKDCHFLSLRCGVQKAAEDGVIQFGYLVLLRVANRIGLFCFGWSWGVPETDAVLAKIWFGIPGVRSHSVAGIEVVDPPVLPVPWVSPNDVSHDRTPVVQWSVFAWDLGAHV